LSTFLLAVVDALGNFEYLLNKDVNFIREVEHVKDGEECSDERQSFVPALKPRDLVRVKILMKDTYNV
jgi:hypothetical protein